MSWRLTNLLPIAEPPAKFSPSEELLQSIYPLYWKDSFLGSCVAITPKVAISAGHHFNMIQDDVGDFTILIKPSRWISAEYAKKILLHDVLVLWLDEPVHCSPLRGYLPPVHCRVATVWLSPKSPHDAIFSPGLVISSDMQNSVIQGTVSTTGSSGAPVVDFYGDHIVGMHLSSNVKNGSRVSHFISARQLVLLLAEMNVSCR